jgi:spore coat polysaccharide biosynthesis protein SpsF
MNEQEAFWAGQPGTDYFMRHGGPAGGTAEAFRHRQMFWRNAIDWDSFGAPASVVEFGANMGINLTAICSVCRELEMQPPQVWAVEINETACQRLQAEGIPHFNTSILDYDMGARVRCDLAFTMGMLIHIAPEDLPRAYEALHFSSLEWVLMAEYFCPTPREIEYRGEKNKLWARDFAGEFMDMFPAYRLWNYGFVYKRDKDCPLDNINWFLLRKDRSDE